MNPNVRIGLFVVVVAAAMAAVLVVVFGSVAPDLPAPGPSGAAAAVPTSQQRPERAEPTVPTTTLPASTDRSAAPATPPPSAAAPATRMVTGRVLSEGGAPIAGATITMRLGAGAEQYDFDAFRDLEPAQFLARRQEVQRLWDLASATSDALGRFTCTVPAGDAHVSLVAAARGYRELLRTLPGTDEAASEATSDVGIWTLVPGPLLAGKVVDAEGRPVAGAAVGRLPQGAMTRGQSPTSLMQELDQDECTKTDTAGHFELPAIGAGTVVLRAEHPDHAPAQLDAFVLGATEHRTDLVLTLAPGASITGVVQDPLPLDLRLLVAARQAMAGHDPAAARDRDIRAEIGDGLGDRQCEVAPDQTFELGGLDPAATYTVWLVELREGDFGFPVASTPIDVRAGSRGVALRHEAGASVSFVVVDASTNAPLTQLQVASSVGQGRVLDFVGISPLPPQPHEGGRVTLDGLRAQPGDTLRCVVKAPGYQPHTIRDVTVPRAGRLDLGTIRLAPAR
jgi:hypothetical protein